MTAEPEHDEEAPIRSRIVGAIQPCEDSSVMVSHVYEPDGVENCEHGHPSHDPGMVELYVQHGEDDVMVQIFPGAALTLANRLTRAANLALESMEEPPDLEREAGRFGVPDGHEG